MKRLVSIIIPTYNRAHLITETLDSVLAQTYTNWECIVVDDGCTDNTAAILQSYIKNDNRFQYHKRPDTHLPGGNGARNYGFEISNGDYIQWFDDDDVMLPEFIKRKIEFFNDSISLVICSGSFVNNDLLKPKEIELELKSFLFKDYILWNLKILTPSVMFSKEFLEQKALFSEKIFRGQETEFFSRLFFKLPSDKYHILNKSLFLYRQHESSKTIVNQNYVSKFKFSQSYIYLENLKRSIILNDHELINHCYQTLLNYFFKSFDYGDYKTTRYIFKNLLSSLKQNYFKEFIEIRVIGGLMLFFKINSYSVYKRWKNKVLC